MYRIAQWVDHIEFTRHSIYTHNHASFPLFPFHPLQIFCINSIWEIYAKTNKNQKKLQNPTKSKNNFNFISYKIYEHCELHWIFNLQTRLQLFYFTLQTFVSISIQVSICYRRVLGSHILGPHPMLICTVTLSTIFTYNWAKASNFFCSKRKRKSIFLQNKKSFFLLWLLVVKRFQECH